jgi:hypothetical protein
MLCGTFWPWKPRALRHPVDGAVLMGGCDKTTPGVDHGRDVVNLPRSTCPPDRCAATGAGRNAQLRCAATGASFALAHLDDWRGRAGDRALAGALHDDGDGPDDDSGAGALGALPAPRRSAAACGSRAMAARPGGASRMVWEVKCRIS